MTFGLLALVCAVAMLGPIVSVNRRVPIPIVIVELLIGIVVGRSGLQWIDATNSTLSFMAEIGFALVMFVAGTHVPLRNPAMKRGLRSGILRAVAIGVVAVPLGFLIAHIFHTQHGGAYAVLIASSSAGIVLPALAGTTIDSQSGIDMLVQLAIADAACIIALPLVMQPSNAGRAALGAVAVLATAGVFFLFLRWAEGSGQRRRLHTFSENHHLAMELRVTLTLLFTLATIAATMHVSVMLAGFAMGLAVAGMGEPKRLANQTFALTEGFFGPIFFVWLGASLNLRALASHPQSILLGLLLGLGALVAHGLMALTKQPWPIAVTTAAQLGVPVGAAALGTTTHTLVPGEATAMLLGALVTIAAVTALSRRVLPLVSTTAAGSTGRAKGVTAATPARG